MDDYTSGHLYFGTSPNLRVFVSAALSEKVNGLVFTCVVTTMKHGEGGVMVLLVTLLVIYTEFHAAWLPGHSAATCHPIWFELSRTIFCFSQ